MLFGVINMERLIEVAEARQQPFDVIRDVFWKNQEPAVKSSFLGMAQWCEQYKQSA